MSTEISRAGERVMSRPRVSVLMSVFNTEAYVGEAISSILTQTLTDLELIIVDDASTDDSWSVVTRAVSRDPRVIALRRSVKGGASCALNDGLACAKGDYITRQDSDDSSMPTRLSEQLTFLETRPDVGAVGTAVEMVDAGGRILRVSEPPQTDAEIQRKLLDYMCFCGPTVMARRSAFEKAGFRFDESLSGSEDYDQCLRLAEVAGLANLERPLYRYRQHHSSVSHNQRYQQLLRKASALEMALHRRFGPTAPAKDLALVARDYLRASVIGHATGKPGTHECAAKALSFDGRIFEKLDLVGTVVRKYAPKLPSAALAFIDSLFAEVFPHTRRVASLRRQLVAEIHLSEAFALASKGGRRYLVQHVWPAIQTSPKCLANRGVLSLVVKQIFAGRQRSSSTETA